MNYKKSQVATGVVIGLDFPNKGIIKVDDGETAYVKGVLPGQKIEFYVTHVRKNHYEGLLKEVIEKSPDEIESLCAHYEVCGGCSYRTYPYELQCKIKEEQVKKVLSSATEDINFTEFICSPMIEEYRNKMELTFGDEVKGGELTLGMHKKGSFFDIATTNRCKICDPDFGKVVDATLDFCRKEGLPFYHKITHNGILRHLQIRRGTKSKEILVNIVTSSQTGFDESAYVNSLLSVQLEGTIVGITHTINDSMGDAIKVDEFRTLFGQDYFYEELLGLKFKITPFSFFQTNTLGAEKLYQAIYDMTPDIENKVVFDLYSGTGTIAQVIAKRCAKAVGVEIVEEAVEAAKVNAKENGLDNCIFLAGDVFKVLNELEERPDFIILDPPREGIQPKALKKLLSYEVDSMIYVSCKVTSLARDLEDILAAGYRIVETKAVDMFPYTNGIETVCYLKKI
ncbi:MAG: 23S rRNA (uracil(1939)-C(5))-methyltransferase RlmD [Lachnospiraceae bacterium]|nr:23S rRNA (uracil(1939)-C(5))-methyltransferase RlmD [Lachnospiraceae bacterium]